MKRIAALCLSAAVLVACQDSEPTRPPELGSVSFAISDGASGGNSEFFFFPPLADNPRGHANFDDGEFNEFLAPFVKFCHLESLDPVDCTDLSVGDPAISIFPMEPDADNEQYKYNWNTSDFTLNDEDNYRIQVYVGSTVSAENRVLLGYRDVTPLSGPPIASCTTDDEFCQFNNGSNVPIKVRIEDKAFCPIERDCATRSTDFSADTRWQVEGNSFFRLDVPTQSGSNGTVTITFRECVVDDVDDLIDLPTYGPCVETHVLATEDEFDGTLDSDATATISFCDFEYSTWTRPPPPAQTHLIRLHAFHDDDSSEALREAALCDVALSSAPANPVLRLASRIRDRVGSWIGVRPLIASTAGRVSRGGNSEETIRTKFKFALPAKIDYVDPADASRIAPAGDPLSTQAIVTDIEGNRVAGARVRWNVLAPGTGGATVEGTVSPSTFVTGSDGIAQATWTLAEAPGENRLTAGGHGIADPRGEAFNGPRDSRYEWGPFDPFQPIEHDEDELHPAGDPFDDGIDEPEDEVAELIPTGTRLLFSATGCSAITINGIKGDNEWGCAATETFTANVSGGRQIATFYWTRFEGDVYFAVQVPVVTAAEKEIKLTLYLSDLDDGTFQRYDDVLVVDGTVEGNQFSDNYLWDRCPKGKSFCALADPEGPDEGDGEFLINTPSGEEPFYFFEARQRENAENVYDIDATSHLGVSLTLRIGKGRWGNTEWPVFGEYETLY